MCVLPDPYQQGGQLRSLRSLGQPEHRFALFQLPITVALGDDNYF